MKRLTRLVVALCLAFFAPIALAAVPQTITFQGFLTSAGGTPVNSPVAITFRLYDAESGGVALWTETKPVVNVSNGIFTVLLGSPTPIPLPFDVPCWISVAVDAEAEMAPRQPLATSPYALRSATADALAPTATIAGAQITGSITTATIPVEQVIGAVPGPPGPPGPTSVANCPAGMTKVVYFHSTLCFAAGPSSDWGAAGQFCDDSFRANLCTLQQWRTLVCRAGVANPGASWTPSPVGTGTFATVSGCTPEQVTSAVYTTQRVAACCVEWMNY